MAGPSPLKKISLFRGLSSAELALLEARGRRERYPANSLVIREGDASDSMFIVLSGSVRVFVSDDDGNEVTMHTMKKNDYFGEYAMFDGSKRTASVATIKDSDFLIISKESFIELFADNPDSAFSLISDLVGRIREMTSTVKNLALMEVQGRVASVLLQHADEDTEPRQVSAKELTDAVGAPSEVIDGIMDDLQSAGYITRDGNKITINESLEK